MIPKEKAKELVEKFKNRSIELGETNSQLMAEANALIAVDEIISQWEYIDTYLSDLGGKLNINLKYWYEVKQEIEKL